ncbi:DUF6220 domain-containing protein [Bacillus sp. J33]|uniref:DUF6220 domain-containing protein n=1 Tax=Bacillus sp. J33 TaxID=935836 RepID=UPI00047EB4AB|nr:DUF6220 domain-containing protein [Bacillus sp. J33]
MFNLNSRVQYSRLAFLTLAWIFSVSIAIQTFLAGLAIFTNYSYWTYHTTFVVWFQFIPILMLVLSFTGNFPKVIRGQVAGLFLLIVPLQYISVNIPGLGAIHPVIALVLFWSVLDVIKKAGKIHG